MRKIFLSLLIVVAVSGCSSTSNTLKNLEIATLNEFNSAEMYQRFAEQAVSDSLPEVAALFTAMSRADAMLAMSFLKEMRALGSDVDVVLDTIAIKSTLENLYRSKVLEEYNCEVLYPDMLIMAQQEECDGASNCFSKAVEVGATNSDAFVEAIANF